MTLLDSAIVGTYVNLNRSSSGPITADDILCDPSLEDRFWRDVFDEYPAVVSLQLPRADLNRRLLRLRKRGEDKGGLPKSSRLG